MKQFKLIISIAVGIFNYLVGGIDSLFISFVILMVIDYMTGICKGIYQKKLSSKIGIKGIIKKIGYIFMVMLATLFDKVIGDSSFAIRTMILYFFIANESLSILENWSSIGLPLPKKIYEVFENLKSND